MEESVHYSGLALLRWAFLVALIIATIIEINIIIAPIWYFATFFLGLLLSAQLLIESKEGSYAKLLLKFYVVTYAVGTLFFMFMAAGIRIVEAEKIFF